MNPTTSRFFSNAAEWECPTIKAYSHEQDAQNVITRLDASPTPETLDSLLAEYPGYALRAGGRCGWTALAVAIDKKALPLIRHILTIAPELVNAAWHDSESPYIIQATCDPSIFQEFVSRGARINLATPEGFTALSFASQDKEKLPITRYLLQHGGIIYNRDRDTVLESSTWSETTKESYRRQPGNIEATMEQILGKNMFLSGSLHSPRTASPASLLPYDTRKTIWSFLN